MSNIGTKIFDFDQSAYDQGMADALNETVDFDRWKNDMSYFEGVEDGTDQRNDHG